MMSDNEGQGRASSDERKPAVEESPAEKLRDEDKPQTGSLIPGAQNPESEEIKDEKSPNTE